MAEEWIHLDVAEIVRETERAFLLRLEGGEEIWVPRSQVSEPDDYGAGDTNCTVSATAWLANEKGLS